MKCKHFKHYETPVKACDWNKYVDYVYKNCELCGETICFKHILKMYKKDNNMRYYFEYFFVIFENNHLVQLVLPIEYHQLQLKQIDISMDIKSFWENLRFNNNELDKKFKDTMTPTSMWNKFDKLWNEKLYNLDYNKWEQVTTLGEP
jgi:hypothetical protein